MPPRRLQPIFIVGQYKCGTTWLLRVLSAHPDVIGVGEIDIVSAACDLKSGTAVLAPTEERLARFFDKSGWCNCYTPNGWEYTDVVARFQRGESIPMRPWNRSEPRKFMHLGAEAARTLYDRIAAATTPEQAMAAFFEAVSTDAEEETHVALKAADQISRFRVLQAWQPHAKKIVITRDGRDASISALHFRELMREAPPGRGSPAAAGYWKLLQNWADQADKVIVAAAQGEVYLLRYEDLSNDFAATMQPLLRWLGLKESQSLLESIQAQTSFEALTGRPRGTEAKGVMRKGAVGEWRDTLPPDEQERAWHMAGEQLRALGYTRDGALQPLPDLSSVEEQPYRLQRMLHLEKELARLRRQLRELQARTSPATARQKRWPKPIHSIVQAARKLTKHFGRLF